MGDIVNEKSLEVLERYDIEVRRVSRGRGGMILSTDKGAKLLLECVHPEAYYHKEHLITDVISRCGYENVDTYVSNDAGEIITAHEDGKSYVLKDWFEGRECNIRDIADVCDTVRGLAKLHIVMEKAAPIIKCSRDEDKENVQRRESESLYDAYLRHTKELKMAANYLRTKKRRQEFEMLAFGSINSFYEEAMDAMSILGKEHMQERLKYGVMQGELCHGSFNYHNVMFVRGELCITNFDKVKNECQIVDLYQFMRKILEKYDWNIELAYKMIDEYDKVRMVTETDLEILAALFAFPEKYWKIINYYFNMNKAWIPPKSIDKLRLVIEQNVKRKEFIETLFA